MKELFILLAVLNIGFFVWQSNREETGFTPPVQDDPADGSKRLILLRELDAEMAKTNPAPDSAGTSSAQDLP